jgi:hypothetical protein
MFSQATYSRKLVFLSSAWTSYAWASSYCFGITNTCHYISSEFLSDRWSPEMLGIIGMTGSPGQLYAIIWTFIVCMIGSLVLFELGALGVWLCFFGIVCLPFAMFLSSVFWYLCLLAGYSSSESCGVSVIFGLNEMKVVLHHCVSYRYNSCSLYSK